MHFSSRKYSLYVVNYKNFQKSSEPDSVMRPRGIKCIFLNCYVAAHRNIETQGIALQLATNTFAVRKLLDLTGLALRVMLKETELFFLYYV